MTNILKILVTGTNNCEDILQIIHQIISIFWYYRSFTSILTNNLPILLVKTELFVLWPIFLELLVNYWIIGLWPIFWPIFYQYYWSKPNYWYFDQYFGNIGIDQYFTNNIGPKLELTNIIGQIIGQDQYFQNIGQMSVLPIIPKYWSKYQ